MIGRHANSRSPSWRNCCAHLASIHERSGLCDVGPAIKAAGATCALNSNRPGPPIARRLTHRHSRVKSYGYCDREPSQGMSHDVRRSQNRRVPAVPSNWRSRRRFVSNSAKTPSMSRALVHACRSRPVWLSTMPLCRPKIRQLTPIESQNVSYASDSISTPSFVWAQVAHPTVGGAMSARRRRWETPSR